MARTILRGGMELDIPSPAEIRQIIGAELREQARGWKHMRLPTVLTGTVASSAISLTVGKGFNLGPSQGYAWSIRRLIVNGLTASSTAPDIVNLYYHSTQQPVWQFNGNSFGYTFDRGEITVWPGDRLELVNVGSLTATGVITLSGELDEVPAEMMWKLTQG